MRLGQLARKYDIPVQEIISYLEEETGERFHANAKIYDMLEEKVFNHFDILQTEPLEPAEIKEPEEAPPATLPIVQDEIEPEPEIEEILGESIKEEQVVEVKQPLPSTPEEEILLLDGEIAFQEDLPENHTKETEAVEPEVEKIEPSEDEIIQTDKLLEMLESDEAPADLDKIKLIKAPKKELSGLKVLGKVDLPEPKKKSKDEDKEDQSKHNRNRRPQLSEVEKEKRRLKAKKKKEAYEARQERRRKEEEAQRRKELKEAHYKQNLQKIEVRKQKKKGKPITAPASHETKKIKKEPKTWLGKWWKWMNT